MDVTKYESLDKGGDSGRRPKHYSKLQYRGMYIITAVHIDNICYNKI